MSEGTNVAISFNHSSLGSNWLFTGWLFDRRNVPRMASEFDVLKVQLRTAPRVSIYWEEFG